MHICGKFDRRMRSIQLQRGLQNLLARILLGPDNQEVFHATDFLELPSAEYHRKGCLRHMHEPRNKKFSGDEL